MLIKNIKKIITSTTCITLCTTSILAKANLTIQNNTGQSSTAEINDGLCSNFLGPIGITPAHAKNEVTDEVIGYACSAGFPCEADIFMNDSCEGAPIAVIRISDANTIQKIEPRNSGNFKITYNGTYVEVNGG